MERIVHDTIKVAIEKPKYTKINIKRNCTKVNILRGSIGTQGKDGDVYVPREDNGYLIWEKSEHNNSPISINFGALIHSIANAEILTIVNS